MRVILPSLALICLAGAGCALPDVHLATREPLKVDISMKLDVYNHGARDEKPSADQDATLENARRRKYNRQGELVKLRGTPALAETHRGLLVLREPPAENAAWAQNLVAEENADRMLLMTSDAEQQQRELHEVQDERWRENVRNAQPGERVEIPDPAHAGRWKFDRKQSAAGEPWPAASAAPAPATPEP